MHENVFVINEGMILYYRHGDYVMMLYLLLIVEKSNESSIPTHIHVVHRIKHGLHALHTAPVQTRLHTRLYVCIMLRESIGDSVSHHPCTTGHGYLTAGQRYYQDSLGEQSRLRKARRRRSGEHL